MVICRTLQTKPRIVPKRLKVMVSDNRLDIVTLLTGTAFIQVVIILLWT